MQEIKKRTILLASTLKPVDDTRMYEKLGCTLAERYEVHVAGTASTTAVSNAVVHPHDRMERFSLRRLLLPWKIFRLASRFHPDVLIICTHELLFTAVLLYWLKGIRVIYDVQENYKLNILHTAAFPPGLRSVVAAWVRLKEKVCLPFFSDVLLAEKAYATEMPFLSRKAVILENKVKGTPLNYVPQRQRNRLIFTGTLSSETGVFTAIDLATRLHEIDPAIQLTIAGYCARPVERGRIWEAVAGKDFITIEGVDKLVPHARILWLMKDAGFGVVAYESTPATRNRIPTKLFEYLGHCLPMIVTRTSPGREECQAYEAGIVLDKPEADLPAVLDQMNNRNFYVRIPRDVFWSSEAPKLLAVLDPPNSAK